MHVFVTRTQRHNVQMKLNFYKVTTQQLWKQVYNILGGNPRSTSAATCTRRHYEKYVKENVSYILYACVSVRVCVRLCIWLCACMSLTQIS